MDSNYWRDFAGFIRAGQCLRVITKIAFAAIASTFALCGLFIGSISGAMKGQTAEIGVLRGAVIGAVAGVVVAAEVLETCLQGELLSKVTILSSIENGKSFSEWVGEAILQAYQWQIDSLESSDGESSDIFDITRNKGLLPETIKKLPYFMINYGETTVDSCRETTSCAVCLQDFKNGESARKLPGCGHIFHVICIDMWLLTHGSCPMCRLDVHAGSLLNLEQKFVE